MKRVTASVTVTFLRDGFLPITRDGFDYFLEYSYVSSDLVGAPEEEAQTKTGSVVVGISRTLATVWHLHAEEALKRVLFEYAKRHVRSKVLEDALGGRSEVQLTTANAPPERPFDPARIHPELSKPFRIEKPPSNPVAAANPTALPSEIIDLRDSINAIFGETFGGRLLALPQERHLLELFKEWSDHEQFAYRVASLGGLAAAISPDCLRGNIQKSSPTRKTKGKTSESRQQATRKDRKPLDLLGAFLRAHYPEDQVTPIMVTLKNFNTLRRMYPVHSDRAGGVLPAHAFFNLDYPVKDHRLAGRRLLEMYRDTLQRLLDLLKSSAS